MLALIAIGIAVDDTIHFPARYRVERPRSESVKQAIERTFSTAGGAIVMTSLIFAVGIAPFAFSDYLSMRPIGVPLPSVMLTALVADLLLLPALITVGAIRSADKRENCFERSVAALRADARFRTTRRIQGVTRPTER